MATDVSPWLIVIPARLQSTRLPHKPLQDLGGLPLIVRVYQNLLPLVHDGAMVVVATDAEAVAKVCRAQHIPVQLTAVGHESGTDRCAEVASAHPHPLVLNVQGDEPFVSLDDLRALMRAVAANPRIDLGTLAYACDEAKLADDPNAVKAVRALDQRALYFSRASVPFDREAGRGQRPFWLHLGIYALRRERLLEFVQLPPSSLERLEKLEQLRAIEHGWHVHLEPAQHFARGIDTPQDLEAARALVK